MLEETDKKAFNLRLPPDLMADTKRRAEEENRSINQHIVELLKKDVKTARKRRPATV